MRLRPAVVAAFAAFSASGRAPLYAQASAGVGFGQYLGQGCGTGDLSFDRATSTITRGTLVCVVGTFTFSYFPSAGPGAPDEIRLVGATEQTVSSAFDGSSVYGNGGSMYFTYAGSECPAGVCRDVRGDVSPFPSLLPGTNAREVRGFGVPLPPTADLSRSTLDSVVIFYDYAVRGLGPGSISKVALTFTAIPEPSTLALGATGLAAISAVARRKRRTA